MEFMMGAKDGHGATLQVPAAERIPKFDLEFMVISKSDHHSPLLTIPLYLRSQFISGKVLREKCLAEYARHAGAKEVSPSSYHYAQLDYPQYTYQGMLQFISCEDVNECLFDVREDLMKREHLVVFTENDTLKRIAVDRAAAVADLTPGRGNRKQARNSTATAGSASMRHSITSPHLHSTRSSKRIRPELTFDNVSSSVGTSDVKDVNSLIENGTICVDAEVEPYLCRGCLAFPTAILTMSCCGAVICSDCAPTPPTVQMSNSKDRMCPLCGEEPLEAPQTHPESDQEVLKIVKELKVLYLPDVRSIRRRHERNSLEYVGSVPISPYSLRNASVL
ncbi:hypothetical protein AGDE_13619 [Angomonas deanei]|uniref:Uncharacterized protein n=1 Tax=Angomonas deanei TaxID=59799 RepID=A0A7G2C736_9TRYP|nr:hypothetical protein AGDE_13619 [Angomonas deanei]CAD2215285.1 hypothetical protein, conserved [Angomonas deanei]|eukprot:EPY22058.1 hypothetical protein AGDE_13619 [Angomonas deanei]